jgi:phospholipase C
MSAGLDNLKHIVVLMMSGRSFDHMLGGLSSAEDGFLGKPLKRTRVATNA